MALKLAELNETLEARTGAAAAHRHRHPRRPRDHRRDGLRRATTLTAIGDTVNTASRLESMTKEVKAQLVVSEAVAELGQIDLSAFPRHDLEIRGRVETLGVRAIPGCRRAAARSVAAQEGKGRAEGACARSGGAGFC